MQQHSPILRHVSLIALVTLLPLLPASGLSRALHGSAYDSGEGRSERSVRAEKPRSRPCRVGMNYGLWLSTKPLAVPAAVKKIRDLGATSLKLFNAELEVLNAIRGTDIELVVGIWPFDITVTFAANQSAAQAWVDQNIVPYKDSIKFTKISVANERIDPGVDQTVMNSVVPGMWALWRALKKRKLHRKIKVVTPQHPGFIMNPSPPSAATALPEVATAFAALADFLNQTGAPLYITNFPFYPIFYAPEWVTPNFTFFRGFNGYYDRGLYYQNMFDQQIDSMLVAAEKLGYPNLDIEVGETGWPTGGTPLGSIALAKEYMEAMLGHVCSTQGTPKRPGKRIPTHIFEMFDEDLKGDANSPWEPHWGINYMNGTAKYPLDLKRVYPAPPNKPPKTWCIVKPDAAIGVVNGSIVSACANGLDCTLLKKLCPEPLLYSAVYNGWFQREMQRPMACNFNGTAMTTTKAPRKRSAKKCPFPGFPPVI